MISATHLHAMLIHFPIALLFAGFLTEIISLFNKNNYFKNTTFLLLGLGTLGAIAAYIIGIEAGERVEHDVLKIPLDLHEDSALLSLILILTTAIFYSVTSFFDFKDAALKWFRIVFFSISIAAVTYTAYLGGQLVYKHGAGTELIQSDLKYTNSED